MQDLDLNGLWQFRFCENTGLDTAETTEYPDWMCVPGTFDTQPDWYCQRGTGLYRREFVLEKAVAGAMLRVDGMGLRAKFALDGREIGRSSLAYTPLEFETGPLEAGRHVLTAAVDNTFAAKEGELFLPYYDFYAFGGFYGGVSLRMRTGKFGLDRVFVRTLDFRTGRIRLDFAFSGEGPSDFTAKITFDDGTPSEVAVRGGKVELDVPDFRLWSPETPNLHSLTAEVGGEVRRETFGIREIATSGNRILLNGQDLYLRGFNRHETSGISGGASTADLQLTDLQNLKRLHGNFIRGSHYSQRESFLDLCDRMGVLVWDETLGWGNTPEQMRSPVFAARQQEALKRTIRAGFNHPSIIIWGFMNELKSDTPEGDTFIEMLCRTAHAADDSRLVTFACSLPLTDRANRSTDIIAYNTYPGWISEDYEGDPISGMKENQRKILHELRKRFGTDKPVIVSEMGTCGVYGQRDAANAQWTEDFQAEYLQSVTEAVFAEPDIRGLTIWQMCDAKSFLRQGANIRCKPFAQNLAGSFDIYRRPKLAASFIAEAFARHEAEENKSNK